MREPTRRSCETTLQTELYLESGGGRFPLAQLCHLWVIPADGVTLPPGPGRVVSVIEGHVDAWEVVVAPRRPTPGATSRRVPIQGMRLLSASEAA